MKQGRLHDNISCGGWAGAVIWSAGAVGEAVYTTASVAFDRAGTVMQKPLEKCQESKGDASTDRQSDLKSRMD